MCGTSLVGGSQSQSVSDQISSYSAINKMNPLVSYVFGFHAEYTSSPSLLDELSRASHFYKAPVYSHNSETKEEVINCKKRHGGLTPTEYTDSFGLYDFGGGGFHCLYLNEDDISIYKKHGLYIVSNPGSNSKLASGIAPLCHYLDSGIPLALGTDGPGSNNGMNMFYEMRLSSVLQKLLLSDASAFGGKEALHAATVGSARAMGLMDVDVLDVGKKADIIMIDLSSPDLFPVNDIEDDLVYSGSKRDILMTMIAGKILFNKGRFLLNEAKEDILKKAKTITLRLIKEANQ